MIDLNQVLTRLKKISFFLFLIPATAIIFSLLINNYLASFIFEKNEYYLSSDFNFKAIRCNEINVDCYDYFERNYEVKKVIDLFDCNENKVDITFLSNGKIYNYSPKDQIDLKKIEKISFFKSQEINSNCIKNSNFFWLYDNFPSIADYIYKLKTSPKTVIGTSTIVNPFFYGETSISNIVKRYPVSFFFKPLMFISSLLMLIYWYHNNKIAKKVQNTNKNFKFFYYGFLSAIFLFLHVLFLGSEINNEIFKKARRIIIVLFILFEIISQALLVLNLKKNYKIYENIISKKVLQLKYVLISFMILASILIIFILTFFDLSSRFDYFLEWNYFLILLFFYLLSSLLWKINLNHQ